MIYISAGHNSRSKSIKPDPGAVNKQGIKEGDLTIEFRDMVKRELDILKAKYITDSDEESLAMYLKRIKTGTGSVVVEYHFDISNNEIATGCTAIIEEEADRLDNQFAADLADITSRTLVIRNRGVIKESESHRGRLGLMREDGIICLVELGFISNPDDLYKYNTFKADLAKLHAAILVKYDNMIL